MCCCPADLRSLHIHDAIIEISNYPVPIVASQACSTVRLSKIRFIVNSSVEKHLRSPEDYLGLFMASGCNSTICMEDCVLETTFDSPSLYNLVVCAVAQGGQVGGAPRGLQQISAYVFCGQLGMPSVSALENFP
jgi:hypothetical protein